MSTGGSETLPVEWVDSVETGASGDEYGRQWDVAGRVGGGGRRVVDEADVQLDADSRQLLDTTGNATDVAALLARLRSDLSVGHPLHSRHKHACQRRFAAAFHALGDQRHQQRHDALNYPTSWPLSVSLSRHLTSWRA